MRFFKTTILILFSISITAQSTIFKIDKNYESIREGALKPLLKLESVTIHGRTSSAKIKKFPINIDKSKLAYGFLYYTGNTNSSFKNSIAYLIENYTELSPIIYIDRKGNLDFTDDGAPLRFNTKLDFKINRNDNAFANSFYQMTKSSVPDKNIANVTSYFGSKFSKGTLVSPKHWPVVSRLNVRVSKNLIENKPITILLFDMTLDSYYTIQENDTQYDKVSILEEAQRKDLFSLYREALPINKNSIFSLYGKNYSLHNVDRNGDFVSISETNKKSSRFFKEGSNISSLKIELLNKKEVRIKDLIKKEKYLLIDVGGTWCGGCIAQEPTVKKLSKKIEIIGVFGNDTEKSVIKYVKKRQIDWPVALMSKEFKDIFRISSFPTYILLSPKGKIVMINPNSEKIVEYLSKHS